MTRTWTFAAACIAAAVMLVTVSFVRERPQSARGQSSRFVTADVVIDSPTAALAAWQVEIVGTVEGGTVELVGVEGSPEPGSAYAKPAYYDAAALSKNRVILAAFSTNPASGLPKGKAIVARLHLSVTADGAAEPRLTSTLITAADDTGAVIQPTCTIHLGDRP